MGGPTKLNLVSPFSLATFLERPSVNVAGGASHKVIANLPVLPCLAFTFPEPLAVFNVESDVVNIRVVGGEDNVESVLDETDFGPKLLASLDAVSGVFLS